MNKSLPKILGILAATVASFAIGLYLMKPAGLPPVSGLPLPEKKTEQQVKLAWKFKQDETFYVERTTTQLWKGLPTGEPDHRDKISTAVTRYHVLKTGPKGTVLEGKPEGAKVEGSDFQDFLAKTLGKKQQSIEANGLLLILSPTGQVSSLTVFDENGKSAGEDAEGLELVFGEQIYALFGLLPENEPTRQASWTRAFSRSFKRAEFEIETECTYQGMEKEGDKISFAGKWNVDIGEKRSDPEVEVVQNFEGNLLFDRVAGRLVRLEQKFLKGTVKMKAFVDLLGEKDGTSHQDIKRRVTIRVLSHNPLKK